MRRVRRKGGNKEKVFGCDLLEHLTVSSQEIPLVLRCCSEFVEQNGIVDGIYRLSGVSSNIQKLRGEFESDGSPDLNKDVYLQDIHCVSSLCKAYFRELPNPLLTYQLYDKFAEAVAIQLEEERLVKIRDVLKELPAPHYRTLQFLMHHLVKMASYSSETNMHARNLAIVWAPNLLRSKDIEASGFNGTAAFMEVRVQSIVVEFILTHVPQLFPEQGVSNERRKSLPSPSAMPNQNEIFFRSSHTQPVANFGNISPGDGPLPIRPYHAIIEGTDKRKGSLKGRKWMSIFNIGGRFHDPRRRHKHSAKEKETHSLRSARSMDSLNTPSFPAEGSRRSAQRPPPTNMSAITTPPPQSGSDVSVPSGAIGGSEYAVTYRRGTGLVSGGAGTQGTYTALDPEGLGIIGNEGVQSRSPGLSTKVGRRAAMHITGPTMVTVPLHITSNLALGVLQGGGSDRVIHRGRDKDGGDKVEGKEAGEKVEKKESRRMEEKVEEGRKEEEKSQSSKGAVVVEGKTEAVGGADEEKGGGVEDKGDEEVKGDCRSKQEELMGARSLSREQRNKSINSNTEGSNADDDNGEYMEMKGVDLAELQAAVTQHRDDGVFDASDILNSVEVQAYDHELSGYVQDNFEFLDQMDCSVLDHMDCSVSYQVNEFSVEPPGHSDDEYEVMEQAQPSHHPTELQPSPEPLNQTELNPLRPLSLDIPSRHTKSLSLPYMTSPIHGPEESCSEDEDNAEDDFGDNDYTSDDDDNDDDENMFIKSLPPNFFLSTLVGFDPDTEAQHSSTLDPEHYFQSSEERDCQSLNPELSACKETATSDQTEVKPGEDEDEVEEITKKEEEVHQGQDQQGDDMQSRATEEQLSSMTDAESEKSPAILEASPPCCEDLPPPSDESNDESSSVAGIKVEEEKEEVEISQTEMVSLEVSRDFSEMTSSSCVREERCCREADKETDDMYQEFPLETKKIHEIVQEKPVEGTADTKHKEQKSAIFGTNSDIWEELEEVICEVIEDEESEQCEEEGGAGWADVVKDGEEGEQTAKVSGEKMVEVKEGERNKTEVRIEVEKESELADPEEDETCFPKKRELEEATEEKQGSIEEAQQHDGEEVVTKHPQKENHDKEQHRTLLIPDKQLKEVRSDTIRESRKCEKSGLGGVGRQLVVSKQPRVYQIKAVPVVPPKPQHCKITALTIRQQQQREKRENAQRVPAEQDKDENEKPTLRGGDRERRRDEVTASRNSPLSMCFDEAVAIATMRREKERVREGELDADGLGK
ncbi:rho GTPase-activating protein 30 isoform X1 [Amphiprion ocellaris]|uniref:Rho-GAP domain-containing protein n=1 Tax=Amphiprion ocellaris TaxID=80972 RepID=A0A3Q1C4B6_AMPOC|nr:rho GTPase-activating protein 30 isoform X1 [Amphiprion ocellaris]